MSAHIKDLTATGAPDFSAITNKSAVRSDLAVAPLGEILAADFVTTIASASDFEMIFTPVPCTSGKTYRFEVDFWLKWATAATSGDAIIVTSVASPGAPTVSDNRLLYWIDGVFPGGGDAVNTTNAVVAAAAIAVNFKAHGFFTATSSANFNWGIYIAGWDAGDVVTVFKGAKLIVQQAD